MFKVWYKTFQNIPGIWYPRKLLQISLNNQKADGFLCFFRRTVFKNIPFKQFIVIQTILLEPSDNWDDGIEEDKVNKETPEPENKTDNKTESEEKPGNILVNIFLAEGLENKETKISELGKYISYCTLPRAITITYYYYLSLFEYLIQNSPFCFKKTIF